MDSQPKWRVTPAFQLHWCDDESWGADSIVFHEGSGDTHLLNEVAAEALRVLATGPPMTTAELLARLLALSDAPPGEELTRQLEKLVHEFDELGLIEPAA